MPDHGGGGSSPPRLDLSPGERTGHLRTWATTPAGNLVTTIGASLLVVLAGASAAVLVGLVIARFWPPFVVLAPFAALLSWGAFASTAAARGTAWTLDRAARSVSRTKMGLFGSECSFTWHDYDVAEVRQTIRRGASHSTIILELAEGGSILVGEGIEHDLIDRLAADLRWALRRDREPNAEDAVPRRNPIPRHGLLPARRRAR